MTDALKLKAESADDLTVLASTLQDAILRVGEIDYAPKQHALTLRLSRYQHENDETARILCGLRIDGVLGLKSRGIDRSDGEAMAVLLSMEFVADDTPPGGELHLIFAGGGEILAHIECIDILLSDMGESRVTDKRPLHPLDDA